MTATPFHKILIANRGEIALRVMRTARAMGYRTVAVYSDVDASARHTREADQAVHLGESAPAESYLNIKRIVAAAQRVGADAVHPGYGFLAENAAFAAACRAAGLVFIGPSPESIDAMGSKATAKQLMLEAGVPCVPGYQGEDQDDARLLLAAEAIGYPVMLKATAGGGGRGIRRVGDQQAFAHALRSAKSEARHAFGDARLIVEKAIDGPRHIEVQVFADRHGNVIHLGERDCSVQRRHQKLIEEAPSPAVDDRLRASMGDAAIAAARAISYEGAGTVEFLLDRSNEFYFMEMNTRLQVEHPVTEAITGLDLVELQLRVASGERLPVRQEDIRFDGHAIEVRLCSEDPRQEFAPQSGRMYRWRPPEGVRVEHALESGALVPAEYDSMIAKVIAHGSDRAAACRRLTHALEDLVALGVTTNQSFLTACLRHPVFVCGAATTDFIASESRSLFSTSAIDKRLAQAYAAVLLQITEADGPEETVVLAQRLPVSSRFELDGEECSARVRVSDRAHYDVEFKEHTFRVTVLQINNGRIRLACDGVEEYVECMRVADELRFLSRGVVYTAQDLKLAVAIRSDSAGDGKIRASMTGRIVALHATVGDQVHKGQPIFTLEAMKMEHTHTASVSGQLVSLMAELNQQVGAHRIVAEVQVSGDPPTGSLGAIGTKST
jgi:geranyl-CoA carboxylase alpha subunit